HRRGESPPAAPELPEAGDDRLSLVRHIARRLGVELVRYAPRNFLHLRRPLLLAEEGVTLVLDVGASDGGWARDVRHAGYRGRVIAFEPQAASFARLEATAAGDPLWQCHHVALGAARGTATLHVAGNDQSSSLLPMAAAHRELDPRSAYVAD